MVFDRLREFFSQDFGFVIFHVNERWAGQFANLLKERVGNFVNIVEIRAPNLSSQAKEILARACWGFVKGEGETFDEMFGHCEKKFSEELEKARKDVELTHYVEIAAPKNPEIRLKPSPPASAPSSADPLSHHPSPLSPSGQP
jgi:hypothetical protein